MRIILILFLLLSGCAQPESKVICQPYFAWDQTTGQKYDSYWNLTHSRETTEDKCNEVWFDGTRLK